MALVRPKSTNTLTWSCPRRWLVLIDPDLGPASTVASTPFGLTVTAADLGGTTMPGYRATVHFTSTDPQAVLPADYTFVSGDSGTHTFPGVTLKSPGAQTITAADTLVSDTHGSSAIRVACSGTCQSQAGTAGTRGTKPAPPSPPGHGLAGTAY